jgi:hypothetical protein
VLDAELPKLLQGMSVALGGRLRVVQALMGDLVDSEDIVCAGWVPVFR